MNLVIPLNEIREYDRERVGGKAFALAMMARSGMDVPAAVCISIEAYDGHVKATGLRERILLELNRKSFDDMRWEEFWDASLRIRNMFLKTPISDSLLSHLLAEMEARFAHKAVVVRSSAPGEDSAKASFAGLHESYVNVRGAESIVDYIRRVWASLWSDAALLYRQELGLDIAKSTMAVVVQEIVAGEQSGVVFGQNPTDESQTVIEAVHGLNQGLVDGVVEPDRWILERNNGRIITHTPAARTMAMVPSRDGVRLEALPPTKKNSPPLSARKVTSVYELARRTETLFVGPQDVEWTFKGARLYALQARPITVAARAATEDKRSWYLSLRRSFENLKALRIQIEQKLIPRMIDEGERLATRSLGELTDVELAAEIGERVRIHEKWVAIYWDDFIPFAHGVRLFGQVYNDVIRPEDPYEFVDLLGATEMASLQRNRMLEEMASMVRANPQLAKDLRTQQGSNGAFGQLLNAFIQRFGDLSCGAAQCTQGREPIFSIVLELAKHPAASARPHRKDIEALTEEFLSHFEGDQRQYAADLLDLARASYRLRDDDNIYLGKIEGQMLHAAQEGSERIARRGLPEADRLSVDDVINLLRNPSYVPKGQASIPMSNHNAQLQARQLQGQPAGLGIARGSARVILDPADLLNFKAGEILVCDAVDPSLTFVVPMSSGIVERRGGMLIHGAIIAREYGLPCVTGVPRATELIKTGDHLTVDGYLGIVRIGKTTEEDVAGHG